MERTRAHVGCVSKPREATADGEAAQRLRPDGVARPAYGRMMRGPLIMAAVATLSGASGIVLLTRPVRSEPARYARRIAGTMCLGAAALLGSFAYVLSTLI